MLQFMESMQVDGWFALAMAGGLLCSLVAVAMVGRQRGRQHAQVLDHLSKLCLDSDQIVERLTRSPSKAAESSEDGRKPLARWLPPQEELPEVVFSEPLLKRLAEAMRRGLDERPNTEIGFALLGRIEQRGTRRVLVANGMIDAGADDRSSGHVRFDREYQQRQLSLLQALDARTGHIGDAHTHPGSMNECSGGDEQTDVANARASAGGEMVFVIATDLRFAEGRWGGRLNGTAPSDDRWMRVAELRMNFFYLGKASGYRYRRIMPRLDRSEPLLEMPESLRSWSERSPLQFRLDLACLRSIPGWTLHFQDQRPTSLILTRQEHGEQVIVFLDDYPLGPPRVYVQLSAGQIGEISVDGAAPRVNEHRPWLVSLVAPLVQRIESGWTSLSVVEKPWPDEPLRPATAMESSPEPIARQDGNGIALKDAGATATEVQPSASVARLASDGEITQNKESHHG